MISKANGMNLFCYSSQAVQEKIGFEIGRSEHTLNEHLYNLIMTSMSMIHHLAKLFKSSLKCCC